jgi:AcrR family transcriptional regulator
LTFAYRRYMNTAGMSVTTKRVSRQERREQTRAELLAAARRAFLREGFHAASLDAIAEEAGYTKGAFYSNFASKDDVLVAVLEEHFRDRAGGEEASVSPLQRPSRTPTARSPGSGTTRTSASRSGLGS